MSGPQLAPRAGTPSRVFEDVARDYAEMEPPAASGGPGMPTREKRRTWVLVLLTAVLLSALYATQSVLQYVVRDQQPNLASVFALHFLPWVTWVALLPTIYRTAERWPITPDGSQQQGGAPPWRHWGIHAGLALVAPFAHMALILPLVGWLRGWWAEGIPVWDAYGYSAINGAIGTFAQYLIVAAACHAHVAARRARREAVRSTALSAQVAEAELSALRAQLQPHFLFNTLNAITAHVHDEPDVAEEMLERLSALLRLVLQGAASQDVPLARELDIVGHYLGIHEIRFGSRLTTSYDIDPRAETALVPSMLLQPIVENAVVHGAAAHGGAARIAVAASVDGEWLVLRVVNEQKSTGKARAARGSGIGLPNTLSRLRRCYGDRFALRVDTSADRTVAEVRLPLRLSPAPAASDGARV